jgi:hypothetical protein
VARDGVEPPTPAFSAKINSDYNDFVARVALEVVDSAWWKQQLRVKSAGSFCSMPVLYRSLTVLSRAGARYCRLRWPSRFRMGLRFESAGSFRSIPRLYLIIAYGVQRSPYWTVNGQASFQLILTAARASVGLPFRLRWLPYQQGTAGALPEEIPSRPRC